MVPRRVTLPGRPVSKTTVASLEPVRYAAYYDQGGPIPLFHRAEAIMPAGTMVSVRKHLPFSGSSGISVEKNSNWCRQMSAGTILDILARGVQV